MGTSKWSTRFEAILDEAPKGVWQLRVGCVLVSHIRRAWSGAKGLNKQDRELVRGDAQSPAYAPAVDARCSANLS
jgi:hypothetical protein